MIKYENYIKESDNEMSIRDIKLKFLSELISSGIVKPTMNPVSFQEWLDKNVN